MDQNYSKKKCYVADVCYVMPVMVLSVLKCTDFFSRHYSLNKTV